MEPVYTIVEVHVFISSYWFDITSDIVSSIDVEYGIPGNKITDRVASTGKLSFTLRNDAGCLGHVAGYYSPHVAASMPNWRTGLTVTLSLNPEGTTFYGHISDIQPESGTAGARRVKVTVLDWMDYAATYPIQSPAVTYNKRIDEIVPLIIAGMPIQPKHTDFNRGIDTFPTVFDTVTSNTRALSEFNKVTLSELGYIYLKQGAVYKETLVVESRHTRNANNKLKSLITSVDDSFSLLTELGGDLLMEDGSLLREDTLDSVFDNNMTNLEVSYGTNLINQVTVRVYPRKVDSSNSVLYSIASPITLARGETKMNIKGTFFDPDGLAAKVSGKDMLAPLATTDYLLNLRSDGTSADLTANLSVAAVYTSDGVSYSLTNTSSFDGYVTRLQSRGIGIYTYSPVENTISDTNSINTYSYSPLVLDMKYQDEVSIPGVLAQTILDRDKNPKQVVNSVSFIANTNLPLMNAFLNIEVGDLIQIKETQTGTNGFYYIQNIKFDVLLGGIITFTYGVKEAVELSEHFWWLDTIGSSELGSTSLLGY